MHLRAGAFPWESPPHVFGLQAHSLAGLAFHCCRSQVGPPARPLCSEQAQPKSQDLHTLRFPHYASSLGNASVSTCVPVLFLVYKLRSSSPVWYHKPPLIPVPNGIFKRNSTIPLLSGRSHIKAQQAFCSSSPLPTGRASTRYTCTTVPQALSTAGPLARNKYKYPGQLPTPFPTLARQSSSTLSRFGPGKESSWLDV